MEQQRRRPMLLGFFRVFRVFRGYSTQGRWVGVLAWVYLAVALGAWGLLYASDLWWPATLILFGPRWVLLLPLVVLVPVALWRRRRAVLVVLAAGLVVAGPVMGLCVPWGHLARGPRGGWHLRVLTCNLHYRRHLDPAPLEAVVARADADVVVLQEWDPVNHSAMLEGPGWNVGRTPVLFLASRLRIRQVEPLGDHSTRASGALLRCDLDAPVGIVHFFNLHLASPRRQLRETVDDAGRGPELVQATSDTRWEQMENVARQVGRASGPVVLAGDFNTPPQSAIFRRLWPEYDDAFGSAGWGWGYTFYGGRTMVRIDHVLTGPGWWCKACWVGPDVGSPHRPVVADLVWIGG
jgi:endonuclease/exonuclease/phosphatase (EEP) superfamily protein YafD